MQVCPQCEKTVVNYQLGVDADGSVFCTHAVGGNEQNIRPFMQKLIDLQCIELAKIADENEALTLERDELKLKILKMDGDDSRHMFKMACELDTLRTKNKMLMNGLMAVMERASDAEIAILIQKLFEDVEKVI